MKFTKSTALFSGLLVLVSSACINAMDVAESSGSGSSLMGCPPPYEEPPAYEDALCLGRQKLNESF